MKKIRSFIVIMALAIIVLVIYMLYIFNIIPHKKYTNADFGIENYISTVDKDGDGIDDQTDILQNVRVYIETKPEYKSKYYAGGYPDDKYGVCTDVVAQGLLHSGYDLQKLVDEDIAAHPDMYDVEKADPNIDFRRVRNLLVYFKNHAISLTTDITKIKEWQGGARNKNGLL